MREIKFRAWDSDEKTMCPVYELHFGERIIVARVNARNGKMLLVFSDCTETNLMQYTGVKDKNGVEIYDGDIIHFPYDWFGDSGKDFIVRWNESCCAFVREPISGSRMWGHASREILSMCEVVGNIYENPELVSNETDT